MICIFFFKKKNSYVSFVVSGLNDIFHWQSHCFIFCKSSLNLNDDITGLVIVEKSEKLSATSFGLHCNPKANFIVNKEE